jgi:hypothetical protein
LQAGYQDHQIDDDREDRPLNKKISELHLAVLRFGSRIVSRLDFIVDLDSCPIAQLENAGTHNLISGLDTRYDGNLISTRALDLDELLAYSTVGIALWVFKIGDDIH